MYFLKANILRQIWLKFVLNDPVNSDPEFVQVIAWRRTVDKPLSAPTVIQVISRNPVFPDHSKMPCK